jgi:hypothetical protein
VTCELEIRIPLLERRISLLVHEMATKFQGLYTLIISGSSNTAEIMLTLSGVGVSGNLQMAALLGGTYEITHFLSFYTKYRIAITKVEVRQYRKAWTLLDIRESGESKMATSPKVNLK